MSDLQELLACPVDRQPLKRAADAWLECAAGHRFPVVEGVPVLLRDGRFLVASFHPELTSDTRVHERFLDLVREESGVRA